MNVSKDNVVSNLYSDYPNLCSQVVPGPEVLKQRQSTKKALKLPKGGMYICIADVYMYSFIRKFFVAT